MNQNSILGTLISFLKQPTIIDDNGVFSLIIYFQSALVFQKVHI
jgi:hypothetical protein